MQKHVHFIGIAGHAMAPIAKMFADMGWLVTGSDQSSVVPPVTTYLANNKINFSRGYSETNLKDKPDLVVIGRSALMVDKENPEVKKADALGCRVFSYPEILKDYLVKENSVVVAGTYGKTTSTALIAWILEKAGLNPSFMFGGPPINFSDGVRNTDSKFSVIEGDETPAMSEEDPSKFLYYKPKFVLLTAAKWDHPEVFKSEEEYIQAFTKFVQLIPQDGVLVACKEGENNEKIANKASCKVIWYSSKPKEGDFWFDNISSLRETTKFDVVSQSSRISLETSLLGEHNLQNIAGVVALCHQLNIDDEIIKKAVTDFRGIKMRLENLGEYGGVLLYRDYAQHPVRVKEALSALRQRYPGGRIFCVFDPHATVLQQRQGLDWYRGNFDLADEVLVTKVTFPVNKPKEEWVKGPDIVGAISVTQKKVFYEPREDSVVEFLTHANRGDVVAFMSSGGSRTIEIIEKLKIKLNQK